MAVLGRRTWPQLRNEALLRLGNPGATGMSSRVEYFMTAAYRDLALTYHHFELDVVDTSKALSTSNNEVALPTDCHIVVAVRLLAVGSGTILGFLKYHSTQALFGDYLAAVAPPKRYTRFASKLYVEKKPDAAYPIHIYYYKLPAAPDFTGAGSPEISEDMDEHLLEGTIRKAAPALGRPDIGSVQRELLVEWLGQQVRPDTVSEPLAGLPERQQTHRTLGGAQG